MVLFLFIVVVLRRCPGLTLLLELLLSDKGEMEEMLLLAVELLIAGETSLVPVDVWVAAEDTTETIGSFALVLFRTMLMLSFK